jgi:hypothetical protein
VRLGGLRRHGSLDLGVDAAHDIGDGFRADQILFPDLKAELFFQIHDEFKAIKAADAKVINKLRIVADQRGIEHKGFRQDFSYSAAGVQMTSSLRLP